MRHLIVARHNEQITWVNWLAMTAPTAWNVTVVNNGHTRPNVGREAGAYLWWILANYERLHPWDFYAFVQADPFPHCGDILDRLHDQPGGWQPLGDQLYDSDAMGLPHHAGLPVAMRYEQILDAPFPGQVQFYGGGQFMCRGSVLRLRPKSFYEQLAEIADDELTGGPWVLERLWACIFGRTAESHHAVSPCEPRGVLT